ncbi:hypothetical protein LF817_19595, partial [Halobacillus sp. A1]|uniref:hypothetical protein n=1 Tax=Halobacillus sp. A1 TaxID=2880262 RepID=UPI0020A6B05A
DSKGSPPFDVCIWLYKCILREGFFLFKRYKINPTGISCGMRVIGEIPEGGSLRKLTALPRKASPFLKPPSTHPDDGTAKIPQESE